MATASQDASSGFTEAGPSSPQIRARLVDAAQRRKADRGAASRDDEVDSDNDSIDGDELFDELERELDEDGGGRGVMGRLREQRMAELQRLIKEEQAARNAPKGSGMLTEPSSEKELIALLGDRGGELNTSGTPIVVHFYHKEFRRCDIMDKHLELLAAQHPEALFVKISVLASPFLVEKLSIKVLPCLVVFGRRAQVKDRVVGFEDLGNSDGFTTQTLEWRLAQGGALHSKTSNGSANSRPILGFAQGSQDAAARGVQADDYDDLDWD